MAKKAKKAKKDKRRQKDAAHKKQSSVLKKGRNKRPKCKRGRPKGSKNKPKIDLLTNTELNIDCNEETKNKLVKALEKDIIEDSEPEEGIGSSNIEQIMFKVPRVDNPLIGTPKQVQRELDLLAIKMQKNPNGNNEIFDRIHLYMHNYLVNVVLRKFPFITGLQTADIYQETLIALRFKAIPGFQRGKGMSFLNFSKMCIRRHLITLLNTAKNRIKDKTIKEAVPIYGHPGKNDESEDEAGSSMILANIIADKKDSADTNVEKKETFNITKKTLLTALSKFERIVFNEYLTSSSYKNISKNVSAITNEKCDTKSIDNALLRIRKKAMHVKRHCKPEDIPLFNPKKA